MPAIKAQFASIHSLSAGTGAPSLAEIISALSFALDLTEGAVPGHALRCCLLGMRLGNELGFSNESLADLYHALLLKDVGCSSNAARMCQIIGGGDDRAVKSGVKLEDWTRPHQPSLSSVRLLWNSVLPDGNPFRKFGRIVKIAFTQHDNNREMIQLRCDRGASIVRKIGMSEQTALAVRSLDEHWDGGGYPESEKGEAISPLARVMAVAQHLDVFALERGPAQAMQILHERSGRWFDPQVVKAAESLRRRGALWMQCLPNPTQTAGDSARSVRASVLELAPPQTTRTSPSHIDLICEAFAEVVDAKSHFTFSHSIGVTDVASAIGSTMGHNSERRQLIHRAALLHDLGKLSVPNSILDKPGKLDGEQWVIMREHAALTRSILSRVSQFRELAFVAGAHHERLDGSGYPNKLKAADLPIEARILAVADVYSAITENRPYRAGSSPEQAMEIMKREARSKLDADCVDALAKTALAPSQPSPFLVPPASAHSLSRAYHLPYPIHNSGSSISIVQ
ncbi:MAG: HD domain-containing phosphohydrolase [Terracidiphilus sp.]|jgi:HD-GYP domain-containing protein (c-di-GMP phosphodiesterase class II)